MNAFAYTESIAGNCRALDPQPTDAEPRLCPLEGIRVVLFDIYGTLLISASGDIGAQSGDHRSQALLETVELFGLNLNCPPAAALRSFEREITTSHAKAKARGVEYPEVNIVEVWQATLEEVVEKLPNDLDWQRFSLEYEVRVNPVWPMPGVEATLDELAERGLVLGIVSNAQFFTPLMFPPLLSKSLAEFGFDTALSYFSYEYEQAKPGTYLYELAVKELAARGIKPAEALYVGNDMLNDVAAASIVGFRTALFAGDRRSLRLRSDDDRVRGVEADLVITELTQLADCIRT